MAQRRWTGRDPGGSGDDIPSLHPQVDGCIGPTWLCMNTTRTPPWHHHCSIPCPREYPAPATAVFLAPLALPLGYALGFSCRWPPPAPSFSCSLTDGLAEYPGWSRRVAHDLVVGSAAVVFARYDVVPALTPLLAVGGGAAGSSGAGPGLGR